MMRLLTPAAAAQALGISEKTLRFHVLAGDIRYVLIGQGTARKRRRFTLADLEEFEEGQHRREAPCPSTARRKARSGTMTSGAEVFDFQALRAQLRDQPPSR